MSKIAIVGAGWLGLPLAHRLKKNGHEVIASKTTKQGCRQLEQQGIHSFHFEFSNNLEQSTSLLEHFLNLHSIDVLIGAFPPGFRSGEGQYYSNYWQAIVDASSKSSINKIIKISSTTVYPNIKGDMDETCASFSIAKVNEGFSPKSIVILKAEQAVIDSQVDYVVVRCSGLMGADRHPSRFVAKMKTVSCSAPANMLRQEDAIEVIAFAVANLKNTVVNATSPLTVSKAEYYQRAIESAASEGVLVLPPIVDEPGKRILTDKLISFGYQYLYPNTLDAL